MIGAFSRRGQPLFVLALLLGSWVSARAVMWEPDAAPPIAFKLEAPKFDTEPPLQLAARQVRPAIAAREAASQPGEELRGDVAVLNEAELAAMPGGFTSDRPAPPRPAPHNMAGPAAPRRTFTLPPPEPPQVLAPAPAFAPVPVRTAIGHHMLWMAAMARVPMPADFAMQQAASGRAAVAEPPAAPQQGTRRWSADSWVLWRRGSTGAASGALLTPSYGASQAGAVVRYRLAPGSALRPAAYLRTTAALNGSSEREAALGLQLRPISGLPVALAGEARLTAVPGRIYLRPAIFAVTELPPFGLPLGLRGEAYGQVGYVGGRFATGFAEGQLRVDRRFAGLGKGDVRLGGGVWGGVQKGASRVDAGPSLTIGQPLGGSGSMRLAADWRFRVAGKAAPGSGPAVTLSAGF